MAMLAHYAGPVDVPWEPMDKSPAAVAVAERVRQGPVSIRRLAAELGYAEDTVRHAIRELGLRVTRSAGGRRMVGG